MGSKNKSGTPQASQPASTKSKPLSAKERAAMEERAFLASLPADRFGVNPTGSIPIAPKGPRKGSKRKAPGL